MHLDYQIHMGYPPEISNPPMIFMWDMNIHLGNPSGVRTSIWDALMEYPSEISFSDIHFGYENPFESSGSDRLGCQVNLGYMYT